MTNTPLRNRQACSNYPNDRSIQRNLRRFVASPVSPDYSR